MNDRSNKIIKIQIIEYNDNNIFTEHVFDSTVIKIIRIGRSETADVIVKDISVSRIHCTLVYENKCWVLYDGNYKSSKNKSTNGIW